MYKVIRIEKFNILPTDPNAGKEWKLWYRGFSYFLTTISGLLPDKLEVLFLHIGTNVSGLIESCDDFDQAISALQRAYIKVPSEVHARHVLSSRVQQPDESIDTFLQSLNQLSTDCNFSDVSASTHRDLFIRDSFIRGLKCSDIRVRLLENSILSLDDAVQQARALEEARKRAEAYIDRGPTGAFAADVAHRHQTSSRAHYNSDDEDTGEPSVSAHVKRAPNGECYNCGGKRHPNDDRKQCPARSAICRSCGKLGHFAKVCRSNTGRKSAASCASVCATSGNPTKTLVKIADRTLQALLDTGSSENFIDSKLLDALNLPMKKTSSTVHMASAKLHVKVLGSCTCNLNFEGANYDSITLLAMPDLCCDVILGQPFLQLHEKVSLNFGGNRPPLNICAASPADFPPVQLFRDLSPECKPVAVKSRHYSSSDRAFIKQECDRLLSEGVIEPSHSPWRAQVVVVSNDRKRRLVVDFSETINKYTYLDAYPLPRIEDVVNSIAKYKFYSVIDLKHAYDQVEIREEDRHFTAFQGSGGLYQFKRIPQGVTNAVAAFQRTMSSFIRSNQLQCTFSYLDDIVVCGSTQEEHDWNLSRFLRAATKHKLIVNRSKCNLSQSRIHALGYLIENGTLRPDPSRLQGLMDLPVPTNLKSLKRLIGFFAYYSKWIQCYSSKIQDLVNATFPLSQQVIKTIDSLKKDISEATLVTIDENEPFVVETDASERTIAATLLQKGRPVAFFSRSLNRSEINHHIIEKEAYAIIEAIRRWRELLSCRQFTIVTDQRAVSYMLNTKVKGKVKNDKILRWRLELTAYSFDICYRSGKENVSADALSRSHCRFTTAGVDLIKLHDDLIHPGVQRLLHFVRSKNLPFSVDEVRRVTDQCKTCAKIKPRFYKPEPSHLIRAMSPFERISVDFKGPLPRSPTGDCYMLTVIDEFSRFPFAFPCKNTNTESVMKCLSQLFTTFGLPEVLHTDRGSCFMSETFKSFLRDRGVTLSHTTPYHPQGNAQCERYNATIWNTVRLALESRHLPPSSWEDLLPDCLHAIRSLLCTSTNMTPHERLFSFPRKSSNGYSLPSWLCRPGPVYLRRHVRHSKHEPLVDEVELLETHPKFARIKLPSGRESTVALKDLAPLPGDDGISPQPDENPAEPNIHEVNLPTPAKQQPASHPPTTDSHVDCDDATPRLRRSNRPHKPREFHDHVRY